jgi:hypothetical protein
VRVCLGCDPADVSQQRFAAGACQHETVASTRQLALCGHQRRLQPGWCRRARPTHHDRGARAHLRRRVAGDIGAGQAELMQQQRGGRRIVGRNKTHHDMEGGLAHRGSLNPIEAMSACCPAPAATHIGHAPDALSESSDSAALQELDAAGLDRQAVDVHALSL